MTTHSRRDFLALSTSALVSISACAAPRPTTDVGPALERLHVRTPVGVFDAVAAGPRHGSKVLLLHGFPEFGIEWERQLIDLGAAGYRAVAPDQRGYSPGARPIGVEQYTVDYAVGDAVDIADRLGWRRFNLVGHDWGAVVGWVAAARHPDRVQSLTAVAVPHPVLPVTGYDDDGVIGVDGDRVMRTAPLGVVSGAVVGVVTGCPSG